MAYEPKKSPDRIYQAGPTPVHAHDGRWWRCRRIAGCMCCAQPEPQQATPAQLLRQQKASVL